MRIRAGIILFCIATKEVLLIYRRKKSMEFWVVPVGGVNANEDIRDAAIREIKEELDLEITKPDKVCIINSEKSIEHYYYSVLPEPL